MKEDSRKRSYCWRTVLQDHTFASSFFPFIIRCLSCLSWACRGEPGRRVERY